MTWQDVVYTTGGFVFILALVPMVRRRHRTRLLAPPRSSCLLNAAVLTAMAPAAFSLGLYLSAGTLVVTAALWLYLWWPW